MKNLHDILESLLDDDDEIVNKATGPIETWLSLLESPVNWQITMEKLLDAILSKKVKSIKIPTFNRATIEKFRAKLSNDAYYLYVKRDHLGNLRIVAASHGIEGMYGFFVDDIFKSKQVFVNRFDVTTPAKLYKVPGGRDDMSLYVLPKEYEWLYRRMKEEFENNN